MEDLEAPPNEGAITLPNGCTLYWSQSEMGRVYASDEVGGGVFVWDPSVVDSHTLLAAIVQEETFRRLESEIARRKGTPT